MLWKYGGFTTLPVLCNHILNLNIPKLQTDSNANVAISILVTRVALPHSLISIYFKKIEFTQLQKRCANNGLTGCINIPFWSCWLIGVGGERRLWHKFTVPKVSLPHKSRGIIVFHMFAKMASQKLFPTHSSSWLVLFPKGWVIGWVNENHLWISWVSCSQNVTAFQRVQNKRSTQRSLKRICLKELSFQTIDIIKSKSEICTVSLPLKVSKF